MIPNCEHEYKLNSTILFVDKQFYVCFANPHIIDFEICIKCGQLGKLIKEPDWDKKGCC